MMTQHSCRDCEKCTERGATSATKKAANAGLIVSTLGMSVVASKLIHAGRKLCPKCGHPLTRHCLVNGIYQD